MFLIIDQPSTYNIFLRLPTIIDIGPVISQKDLLIKYRTKNEVGCIRGEQLLAHQLYFVILHPVDKITTYITMYATCTAKESLNTNDKITKRLDWIK